MTTTNTSERALFDQVERIRRQFGLNWKPEERAGWLAELEPYEIADVKSAIDAVLGAWTERRPPRPHDVIQALSRVRKGGERPVSTKAYQIVCQSCGERRTVGPGNSGWGTHSCWVEERVRDWRRMPVAERPPAPFTEEERAEIQARGLAACTGKPERVAGRKGGGHGE